MRVRLDRWRRRTVWVAALFLLPPGLTVRAAGLEVLQAGAGFRVRDDLPQVPPDERDPDHETYVARPDSWVPFEAVLANRGPELAGTLVLEERILADRQPVVYTKRVTLPSGATKRVSFPVIAKSSWNLVLRFQDDELGRVRIGDDFDCDVPAPRAVPPSATLALVATTSPPRYRHFLSDSAGASAARHRFLLPIGPRSMPEAAIEYSSVDLAILDDVSFADLSAEQQDAIRAFVARGGTLVIALGPHSGSVAGSRLEALLPGLPGEVTNVDRIEALENATGVECRLDQPIAVVPFQLRGGAVGWDSARLVAHRRHDRGVVIALGFPFSARFLETWAGSLALAEVLESRATAERIPLAGTASRSGFRDELAVALKDSMVRDLPGFASVLAVAGSYCVLVAVVPYLVFRRLGRLEWAWAAIVLLAAAGGAGVYAVGSSAYRGESVALRVGLVEGGTKPGPHLRHDFWAIFTARGGIHDLSFADPQVLPLLSTREPELRGSRETMTTTISHDGARLVGLRTHTQDSILLEGTGVVRLSGAVEARPARREGTLSLSCHPSLRARRAWVVSAGKIDEIFGLDGAPELRLPETAASDILDSIGAEPDRPLAKCLPPTLRHALAMAASTYRPLLVVLHESEPVLDTAGIRERGLDFLFVELPGLAPATGARTLRWKVRRLLAPAARDPELLEYEILLEDASGCVVESIDTNWGHRGRYDDHRPAFEIELCDWTTGIWHAHRKGKPADRFLRMTPLGSARARLRISHLYGYYGYGGYESPDPDDLVVVSRVVPR